MRGVTVAPERIAVKNGFPTTVGDGAVTVELAYQIVGDRRRNFVERRLKPQTPQRGLRCFLAGLCLGFRRRGPALSASSKLSAEPMPSAGVDVNSPVGL